MGTTIIRVLFNVDYIDLDYGYIGGYYSIGLSGPATGGGSGYGIIRMQENAYPLNPVLTASSNKVEEESSTKRPENQVVKPDVKDISLKISDEKDSTLANVEIKSEEPLVDDNSSEENVDSDYPNGMSAESIVRDNKIVLRPEPTDLRPIEVNSQGFDEVSIDELDEYIK
jgi:hypothetical protein